MKIACSQEASVEVNFVKHLYETETINFNSFLFLKKIKDFDLFFITWPEKKSLFWLSAGLFLYRSKKLVIFAELQKSNYKLSFLDKKILLRANRIICSSLEGARHGTLTPIYWKAPEKFREISYGVDLEKYAPRESLRPSENSVIAKFKTIINFVTKKVIKKGLPNILIASDHYEEWQEFLTSEEIKARILFFNKEEKELIKKIKSYQEADIFVAPEDEGVETSHQITEAFACGLVVLAPRDSRLNNIFDHDKQGLFFKPGDRKDLAEKISTLCSDEEKREAMSREARKLAENRYNKKQREGKIIQIIKELEK